MTPPANLVLDVPRLGQVFATMLQTFRGAGAVAPAERPLPHEYLDHPARASPETGVRLSAPIDHQPGAPQPGEYGAPVCAAGPGPDAGLVPGTDRDVGWRLGPVRHPDGEPAGLQETGGGSLPAKSRGGIFLGGFASITLVFGLASSGGSVRL